jgi:hypothetical protein
MTIREPVVDVVGSRMPACGHRMTTWFEVKALYAGLVVTQGKLTASREHVVVIAGSGGLASGHVVAGRYERIVNRSDVVVITSEGMALRSPLRSIGERDVDTWSSVVLSRSLVVEVRYELMGTARDAMATCGGQVKASAGRRDRAARQSCFARCQR